MTRPFNTTRRFGDMTEPLDYTRMPLIPLVKRIVAFSDHEALVELHERRTIFMHNGMDSLLLVQYVDELRNDAAERGDGMFADYARDLTVDKFLRMPSSDNYRTDIKNDGGSLGGSNTDCRNYYRSFLNGWESQNDGGTLVNGMERELRAAKMLRGLVTRHFRLSLLESLRHKSGIRTRYVWILSGGSISLMMPKTLSGRSRRAWLERNVEHPDPARPGERERVQKIIDDRLGLSQSCGYDETIFYEEEDASCLGHVVTGGILPEITVDGLAIAVATEKVDNIDLQRPSIRELGIGLLKHMILEIFDEIAYGDYYDKGIAQKYDLGKATFSRFAGSRWNRGTGTGGHIPDLWANTARVVAADVDFIAAAKETGVWRNVQQLLESEARIRE